MNLPVILWNIDNLLAMAVNINEILVVAITTLSKDLSKALIKSIATSQIQPMRYNMTTYYYIVKNISTNEV